MSGRVLGNGANQAFWNGRAQVTIYDKPTTVMTRWAARRRSSSITPQQSLSGKRDTGQAEVRNGAFSLVRGAQG
jgi:hypothetical protein